jgi:hypothetical protein
MNGVSTPGPRPEHPSRECWVLIASGLAALAPYAAFHGMFGRLYWFGDEYDLIDQFDRLGFWKWIWTMFAENFVPVFKLLWGGGIFVFRGSYGAMIAMVWLTHAVNVALLGRLMRTCGLSWAAVALAQAVFALTPANLETLAWSVQWSAVLSATFMLLAFEAFLKAPGGRSSFAWAAISALSFSRGVLAGPLLALGCFWPDPGAVPPSPSRRMARVAGYLLPAAAIALLIAAFAAGNHRHLGGHLEEAAAFGAWYYLLNPALDVLSVESLGWHTVAALGLCKVALVVWALGRSRDRQRLLFALLVAFDLGNAVLLGIGRYHTGLPAAAGSRYQYASLIGIMPLAGFWFSRQWARLPVPANLRDLGAIVVLAAGAFYMCRQWPTVLGPFTSSRGTESRRILLIDPDPGPNSVPGIPGLPTERVKLLIAKYKLH